MLCVGARGGSRWHVVGARGGGARANRTNRISATMFSHGVGRSALLLWSLGTGTGRDRRRARYIRQEASAVGADRVARRRDYELLRRFPGFDSLPAAQSGEIHLVNASAYFARPGPRIVDTLEILAGILHPKEFPEFVTFGHSLDEIGSNIL